MPGKYSGGFYNDPNDPRFVVPKTNPAMGWTVNIAHPRARLALALIAVVIGAGVVGSVLLG
jgi:uncharacterized membrane protein